MALGNSFRVNLLAIFLLGSILFSSVSSTNYESFAIGNENKIENNIEKISVDHTISFTESMSLSSPEEKKNTGSISIDDQKNIKSIDFQEGLNFSSDISQHESSIIFVKQISDRKGMMERIIANDRIRYQEKLSNKNYFDNDFELIYTDSKIESNYYENPINYFVNLLLDNNFISNNLEIILTENPINDIKLELFVNNIFKLKLDDNSYNLHNNELIIFALISSIILIRTENNNIRFYNFKRFFSYVFIIILISSTIVTPASISSSYWGTAFAEEMLNNNNTSNFENDSFES